MQCLVFVCMCVAERLWNANVEAVNKDRMRLHATLSKVTIDGFIRVEQTGGSRLNDPCYWKRFCSRT
jgi:hypothetical protein